MMEDVDWSTRKRGRMWKRLIDGVREICRPMLRIFQFKMLEE